MMPLDVIGERLDALERANRRLKMVLLAVGTVVSLPLLIGQIPQPKTPDEVRAHRFVLLDAEDKPVAELAINDYRAVLRFLTPAGAPRADFRADEVVFWDRPDWPWLRLNRERFSMSGAPQTDPRDTAQFAFDLGRGGPRLTLVGEGATIGLGHGRRAITLRAGTHEAGPAPYHGPGTPSLFMTDNAGHLGLALGDWVDTEGSFLWMTSPRSLTFADAEGSKRATLTLRRDPFALVATDESGQVLLQGP